MPKRIRKSTLKRRKGTKNQGEDKFKPKIRKLIYKCYEAGIPSATRIADIVGIDPSSLYSWLDKGKHPDLYPAHYAFRQRIMRIESRREADLIACIEGCAKGGQLIRETQIRISKIKGKEVKKRIREAAPQWQAAAWRLERWKPDDYGLKVASANSDESAEDLAMEIQKAAMALDASVPDTLEESE